MATIEYKETRHINPFSNIMFDLGTATSTLPKKLTPVDELYILKNKEKVEREQRINELCEELDNCIDPGVNKETVIKWIEKTDGRYKLKTYIKHVTELENSYTKTIDNSWENVTVRSLNPVCNCVAGSHIQKFRMNIPAFWTKRDGHKQTFFERVKMGKIYRKIPHECKGYYTELQEIHDRNHAIAEIRDKYLSKTKRGKKWYEMHANNYYESPEAYQAFLKEIEVKSLDKKAENKKRLDVTKKELFELDLVRGIDYDNNEIDTDKFYSTRDKGTFEKDFQQEDVERGDF